MTKTLANGVSLHVQRISPSQDVPASGETIVLLHGLVIDDLSSYYFSLASPLSAAGHDVIMYDLRGHGHSDRPPTGYSVDDGVNDLDELLNVLGVTHPVHLVGNSYGGAIAMGMAIKNPHRVADVTLVEGLYSDEGFGKEMAQTLGVVIKCAYEEKWRNWIAERGPKTVKMARRGAALIENTTIQQELLATEPHSDTTLQMMQVPILAIYGGASELLDRARKLQSLVPQMHLIVLPGLDHRVLFNAGPHLCQVLLWWLAGHHGEPPMWVPSAIPFEPAPLSRLLLPELL